MDDEVRKVRQRSMVEPEGKRGDTGIEPRSGQSKNKGTYQRGLHTVRGIPNRDMVQTDPRLARMSFVKMALGHDEKRDSIVRGGESYKTRMEKV